MKKLVTGGAGFIGSHIVDHLLLEGYEVKILDNLCKPTHRDAWPGYLPKEVECIQGDVRNRDDLKKALSGVDVIFHQAAMGGFTEKVGGYIDNNVLGTATMLEVIREEGFPIAKIIVASSMGVYGEGKYACATHGTVYPKMRLPSQLETKKWELECPECCALLRPLATDEDVPTRPERAYSISKLSQEQLILSVGREWGIPVVALRYFLTYGPRQSIFNPYTGICSIFSTMILNGTPPIIFEDGLQTRDFVFVKDVARANLLVMKDQRADNQVFNVGTGAAVSILDVFNSLAKRYRKEISPRIVGEYRLGDVRHMVGGIEKIKNIGFRPLVPFQVGIERYAEWISSMGTVKEYFSDVEMALRRSGLIRTV